MEIPPPGRRKRNIRLVVEYDGARFAGWQVQPNARTVAGVLQDALRAVVGEDVRLVGSGRTDEGVHAEGQVANFLTRWPHPADGLPAALAAHLPEDVGVISATEVAPDFHARHSATLRVYRYHVARRGSVFAKRHAWVMPGRVNVKRLREATELIVGFHDFAAFTDARLAQGASTTVLVTHAAWKELPDQLVFRIAASHFLARMVRRLVGALVRVGTGELPLETFQRWLETGKGQAAPLTAPSMGLFLEHVEYPKHLLEPWQTHPTAASAVALLDGAEGPGSDDDGVPQLEDDEEDGESPTASTGEDE